MSLTALTLRLPVQEGISVIIVTDPNPPPWASPQGWHWGGLGVKRCPPPPLPPQQSGLSLWISDQLHPLENISPALAVFTITCVVIFFTEFASNTATIIIFLPVMSELVRALLGMGGRQGGAPVPPTTQVRNLSPAGGVSCRQPQESLLSSKMCECGRTQIQKKKKYCGFFFFKKMHNQSKYF